MQWGISFKLTAANVQGLRLFPPPSSLRWLSTVEGKYKVMYVFYYFQFAPQNWKEWQRVASIKKQMCHHIQEIKFDDYAPNIVEGPVYTISELGRYFTSFVKWPQPQFPASAGEQYQMLCRHAKRLCYEKSLYIEQLIATSFRFNIAMQKINSHSSRGFQAYRQVIQLAKASYQFALSHCDEWPKKLSVDELKKVRQNSAMKAAETKRRESDNLRKKALALKIAGWTLYNISSEIGVSKRTVQRWLAQNHTP